MRASWADYILLGLAMGLAFTVVGPPPLAQNLPPCPTDDPRVFIMAYCKQIKGEFYLDTQNNAYCGIGPKTPPRARP